MREDPRMIQYRKQRKICCMIAGGVLVGFALGALVGSAFRPAPEVVEVPVLIYESAPAAETAAEAEEPAEEISAPAVFTPSPAVPLPADLQELTAEACERYGVPYALALAVMERESSFRSGLTSKTDDYGYMQINKVNHASLLAQGIDPLTDEGNIEAGCRMLGDLLQRYGGDAHKALMAYNCGCAGARKLWAKGYTSSKYSRGVLALAEKWEALL